MEGDELGGQASPLPEPTRGGREECCRQGTFQKTLSLFALQKHQGGSDVGSPQGEFLRRSSLSGIWSLVGLAQAGAGVRIKCRG